jgi:hypothetical protein
MLSGSLSLATPAVRALGTELLPGCGLISFSSVLIWNSV